MSLETYIVIFIASLKKQGEVDFKGESFYVFLIICMMRKENYIFI